MTALTATMNQWEEGQDSPEVVVNENFKTLQWSAVYGLNPDTTSGITWGYYGGEYGDFTITASTLTLGATATNYIVVLRSTGVISTSTSNTNWNNTTSYARVYLVTTVSSVVTAVVDHRTKTSGIFYNSGTVSSVDASGGVQTVSGSAITGSGTIRGAHVVNAQTGTSYAIVSGDRGKRVTLSNASSIAATIAQAGTTGFEDGYFVFLQNIGVGAVTITPTTSTINGAATLVLTGGMSSILFSDGTNYRAFVLGAAGITVNLQTGTSYTYLSGDRGKLVSHSNAGAIAGTLPQATGAFGSTWFMWAQNTGTGTLTITPTTSTIDGVSSLALTTGQGVLIVSDGTNYYTMRGVGGSGGSGGTELKGLTFTSDTSSQADSDPGSGLFRWNNSTQASATQLFIDNNTADAIGISTFWASLGSAGFIYMQQSDDATKWQLWKWTATPTNGTGYYKFTVTLQASGGSISNSKTVYMTFDGAAAGGGSTQGKQSVYIPAGSMRPSVSGGCATLNTIASAANQPDIQTLDFDTTTQEYAQFSWGMPKKWNEGTITFKAYWSHAATTTSFGVVWDLQAVAVSDDDAIAVAYGTAQTSTDTGGTTNDLYVSPESSAITVAGTPAAEDMVFFRLSRVTGNGSDNLQIDARLHGIMLYITTDADTDA